MRQHVISVQVENKSGVLARIAGLFSARGYNIDSLAVSHTTNDEISIMTIVVRGDDRIIEQVKKQLNKLIDVIKVSDHSDSPAVQRELALIHVGAKSSARNEIIKLSEVFKANIAEISSDSITLGLEAEPKKIDDFIELLKLYGIKELMRTGLISMLKNSEGL
jgi:acetolactate synthase-1/3 small subunit